MDESPLPEPNEREDVRLRPVEGWNAEAIGQILTVIRQSLEQTRPLAEAPFVEAPADGRKPAINTTRVLQQAEQDLAASEKLVEERAKLAQHPSAESRIQQQIVTADARLVSALHMLLAKGVRAEVIVEVLAGVASK